MILGITVKESHYHPVLSVGVGAWDRSRWWEAKIAATCFALNYCSSTITLDLCRGSPINTRPLSDKEECFSCYLC
jgi:hypothetical protein